MTALGGQDKLNAVKTIYTERSILVQGMEIPSKSTVVVGKSMRNESSVMGNSMIQVVDGSTGWMIRPTVMGGTGDPEDMPAEMVKQQASALDPFGPLIGYKEKGNKVELVGKEKVDGKDTYHLKITPKDGPAVEEYLDATTYLTTKVKQMGMDGQPGDVLYSNYKAFEGINFPNTMEIIGGQMGTITFTTNNVPVDDKIFKKSVK